MWLMLNPIQIYAYADAILKVSGLVKYITEWESCKDSNGFINYSVLTGRSRDNYSTAQVCFNTPYCKAAISCLFEVSEVYVVSVVRC